jgi:opacity protein-like surface antigen
MFGLRTAALAIGLTTVLATPAFADLTAFIGANTVPSNRLVRGLAVGFGMLLGFEFEYANTSEDQEVEAPALRTGIASALIQPPLPFAGVQPYLAFGVGLFREQLDQANEDNVAMATGGGVKVQLAGPVRLRIDYRGFRLRGARHSPAHRFYAGVNLAF